MAYILRGIYDYSKNEPVVAEAATTVAVVNQQRVACRTPRASVIISPDATEVVLKAHPVVTVPIHPELPSTTQKCSDCECEIHSSQTSLSCSSCKKVCHSKCCQNSQKSCGTCQRQKRAGGASGVDPQRVGAKSAVGPETNGVSEGWISYIL